MLNKVAVFALLIAGASCFLELAQAQDGLTNYYQWKQVEFEFPQGVTKEQLQSQGKYNQSNIILTALKIYKDSIFVTTPRYRPGVPVTFSVIPTRKTSWSWFGQPTLAGTNEGPKLKPFPSYELNKEGDCNALQTVQSAELDQFGRLWIVDSGRTEILTMSPKDLCPSKLMVLDLENKNKLVFKYDFPDNVASRNASIIKDIQVACTSRDDCFAYISSLSENKLVVFSSNKTSKTSWAAKHPTMAPEDATTNFTISGTPVNGAFGITGLGLSPKRTRNYDTIYFSPLGSTKMYKIPTKTLKDQKLLSNQTLSSDAVTKVADKPGQSDGFAMDCGSNVYYGDLPNSAIYQASTSSGGNQINNQQKVSQSESLLSWPDTWSFDDKGSIFITSTKFQKFEEGTLKEDEYNYRIIRVDKIRDVYAYNSARCQ